MASASHNISTPFYILQSVWSLVATSVPSEQVFSIAGSVVNEKRSRLLPENVDKLVFLYENQTIQNYKL